MESSSDFLKKFLSILFILFLFKIKCGGDELGKLKKVLAKFLAKTGYVYHNSFPSY